MLRDITFEKVQEVIRLAEQAQRAPRGVAADPRRGGALGDHGVTVPDTPLEPQPASDWRSAFERYLDELSDPALAELVGLYRYGHGAAPNLDAACRGAVRDRASHAERRAYLASAADLARSLRRALDRL